MNIYDFMDYCSVAGMCNVDIYSIDNDETVWSGWGDEIPEEYGEKTDFTFDVPGDGNLTFNI